MEGRSPDHETEPGGATGFPCAQCGAALRFAPETGDLACDYCGHRQPAPDPSDFDKTEALRELDYAAALGDAISGAEVETTQVVRCGACGAEVAFDGPVTAKACAFCAEPLVAEPTAHRHFRPKAVLPFLVPERDARHALRDWLGAVWFSPGDLAQAARAGRPMTGVYLPYWTFDASTFSSYDGERGDAHWVERWVTVTKNGARRRMRRRVQEIRWSARSGRVSRRFDDVLVLASRSLPPGLSLKLSRDTRFDLQGLVPYAPAYLAGFAAEAYRVDLEEGYAGARAVMDLVIRRDVRLDIGGDRQRVRRIDTDVREVTFKHVLLPVWIAAYRYRGKPYRYLVNGRTGEVMGERPLSAWKIALAVGLGLLVLGGVLWATAASGVGR